MTRQEFSKVVECFMGELSAICAIQTVEKLRQTPELDQEMNESRTLLRDPSTRDDQMLSLACGLVDQFVDAHWDEVISKAFEFYSDQCGTDRHELKTE